MGFLQELLIKLAKALVQLGFNRTSFRRQDLLATLEDALQISEEVVIRADLRKVEELCDHFVDTLEMFGVFGLQDAAVFVNQFLPDLILLVGLGVRPLRRSLSPHVDDLSLFLPQNVEGYLRVHFAELFCEDAVGDGLLK